MYICFIFFGIILFLLWNLKDKFSIGGQSCISVDINDAVSIDLCGITEGCDSVNVGTVVWDMKCVRNSVNWFTDDNEYNTRMIPNIHNQGECGTCSLYSLIYAFECMYNISKRVENPQFVPISISPQSLIDIFGRYHSKIIPCSDIDYYSHGLSSTHGCECFIPNPFLSDDGYVPMCGFKWFCNPDFANPNTLLYDFAKLKTLDKNKFSNFNFPYPLIKESAVRNNDEIYQTINSCSEEERFLFNEEPEIIQDDDYLYTNHFNSDDLIDFHFNWNRIFTLNAVLTYDIEIYKNMLKERLNRGPVLVNISINPDYYANPRQEGEEGQTNKILSNNILRNMISTHSITIVGYDNDNIIFLNSWQEDIDLIEDCTFEDLYNCHQFGIQNNLPPFLWYNYIYIDLYTDKTQENLCYNPSVIEKYITSCGSGVPLVMAGVGMVSLATIFYKNKSKICPCLTCASAPAFIELDSSDSSSSSSGSNSDDDHWLRNEWITPHTVGDGP